MSWPSLAAFLDMGGAAFYVWGSYGLTFALIAVEVVLLRSRRRHATRRLQRMQRAGRRNFSEIRS